MDNQKNPAAGQAVNESVQTVEAKAENAAETAAKTVAEAVNEAAQQPTQEAPARRKVYKDQDFYPVCAIIMCICFAIGHVLGTYIFQDPRTWSGYGMLVGIVLAIVYILRGGKQIDTSPTKPRAKKEKK